MNISEAYLSIIIGLPIALKISGLASTSWFVVLLPLILSWVFSALYFMFFNTPQKPITTKEIEERLEEIRRNIK